MKHVSLYYYGLILFILFSTSCSKQQVLTVESPDGQITFNINYSNNLSYDVDFRNEKVIKEAKLGFILKEGGKLGEHLECYDSKLSSKDTTYEILFGKRKIARDHYNELTVFLGEKKGNKRKINFQVRVFNDGIAFRYLFPEQAGVDSVIIMDESTNFAFTKDAEAYYLPRPNYVTSHEGYYSISKLSEAPVTLIDLPVLLKYSENVWMAITEANLTDYAGMYLSKIQEATPTYVSTLSPYPGENGIKVFRKAPFETPWRVIMLGDRPARMLESDIIINLNEPCKIEDTSWIEPGKSTWHWWNGTVLKNVKFKPGMNYKTMEYYIDFCARNDIKFHSLVEFNGPWYVDTEVDGWEPGPTADVMKPRPELQMDKLTEYAKEKGVGLRLWVHWKALNKKMEEAFETYEKWGVKSLMVDFMDRDDQEMVNFYHRCLEQAAKYHLTIQFHGAYKPTGIRRTYPNLLTREGVMNTEFGRWCNPDHNLIVPFTRMLAGPMDYHLGCLRAVTRNERFLPMEEGNSVYGTRCHMLAMYVVYESYLQLMCDYPSAYEGQVGFEFIKQVPTVWDEMKVINDDVGKSITIARQSGKDWYVGSMTNWTERKIDIPLSFLPQGEYEATIYQDAEDSGEYPNHLIKKMMKVKNTDVIHVKLASGGGHFMYIKSSN